MRREGLEILTLTEHKKNGKKCQVTYLMSLYEQITEHGQRWFVMVQKLLKATKATLKVVESFEPSCLKVTWHM